MNKQVHLTTALALAMVVLGVVLVSVWLLPVVVAAESQSDSTATAPTFTFKEAIPMPGADILNLNANGTHLLVLHNVFGAPDQVRTYTVEGVEISRLSTDTPFTSGVAWDGSSFLVGRSFIDGASGYDLYRMGTDGNFSPPLFSFSSPTNRVPFGLGFDGVNVWASTGVFSGASGGFDYHLEVIDGTTNDLLDTRIINLDALGIPYGVAWQNNEFFLGLELAQKVFRFDANLNLLETIDVPGEVRGLGFVGDEMFVADRGAAVVYHFVPSSIVVDIKPGEFPNSINPKSKRVIPVAILTTDTFDATTVDPGSVRFGPAGALAFRHKIKDVDRDGDPDLVLHFRTQETGIKCGDTSASLTGKTIDGQEVAGVDSIQTVGCK